jgi:hypothetical protein
MLRIRSIIIAALSVTLVGGTPAAAGTSLVNADPAVATSTEGDLAQAAVFRHDIGFDASATTIARAATDRAAYPDLTFGVPLSEAEATELLRRNQIAVDIGPATSILAEDPAWAGVWIDHSAGGVPVFQFATDAAEAQAKVDRVLSKGVDHRVVAVARSYAELDAIRAKIFAAAAELEASGLVVTSVGFDTIGNRLRVGLLSLSTDSRNAMAGRFGPVVVHEQGFAATDACPETGCMPIKAGIGVTDTNGNWPCTVGYLAKRYDTSPDQLVAITAGHCVKRGSKSAYWQHGSVNIGLPSQKSSSYVHAFFDNSNADVGSFTTKQLSDANRRTRNLLLWSTGGGTADITGFQPWGSQAVNTVVCRTGRTTDIKCGIIQDNNENKYSTIYNSDGSINERHLIEGTVVYKVDGLGGDSGGPVYVTTLPYPYDRYKATMYGTHVDSPFDDVFHSTWSGWYSPIDRGIAQLEASFPGFDIAMCSSAACGLADPIGD